MRSGNALDAPRTYTVEPQKQLSGAWAVIPIGASDYDLSVYGPNGFLRAFKGGVAGASAKLDVRASYGEEKNRITLTISNRTAKTATVRVLNEYSGKSIDEKLKPGESMSHHWSLDAPSAGTTL